MILPARTKWVRGGRGLHFFCPGAGCEARLACGDTETTNIDGGREIEVRLELCYTNGPHPSYPAGTWWRQKRGGYKGIPRARDVRKEMREQRLSEGGEGSRLPEAVGQGVKGTLTDAQLFREPSQYCSIYTRRGVFPIRGILRVPGMLPGSEFFLSYGRRRLQPSPVLPPGTHTVVCDRCGGKASIKAPIAGTLGQES